MRNPLLPIATVNGHPPGKKLASIYPTKAGGGFICDPAKRLYNGGDRSAIKISALKSGIFVNFKLRRSPKSCGSTTVTAPGWAIFDVGKRVKLIERVANLLSIEHRKGLARSGPVKNSLTYE
jgi:hypothetical protein